MKLDQGRDALPTVAGTVFSLVLLIIFGVYAADKIRVFLEKTGETTLSVVYTKDIDASYRFGAKQEFNFAVGLSSFDSSTEYILDKSYGNLKVF